METSSTCAAAVSAPESGQKLLQFLERRLSLPPALLHRWIRTGQIRVNGKRFKPFNRVFEKDIIRLPPFVCGISPSICKNKEDLPASAELLAEKLYKSCGLKLIGLHNGIWAVEKPRGLSTHSGTGTHDSVSSRLHGCFANARYIPSPLHRLDKDTGGILLISSSHASAALVQNRQNSLHKEYLARVSGILPNDTILLRHFLRSAVVNDREKICVCSQNSPDCREAVSLVRPLGFDTHATLAQIRLLTGRKHQIRVQMAHTGHPVIGDGKYGDPGQSELKLHSFRIILPDGHEFISLPEWGGNEIPPPIAVSDNIFNE